MGFEKVVLFWDDSPPVYDEDGKQIFSQYPTGEVGTDKKFDPDLSEFGENSKKKKVLKFKVENNKILESSEEVFD